MSTVEIAVRPRPSEVGTTTTDVRTGPAIRFGLVAAVLLIVNWAANTYWASMSVFGPRHPAHFPGDSLLEGWLRWDGNWYRTIATEGYSYTPSRQSSIAFFPVYPLAMRVIGWVVGDPATAGILITLTCGLAAAVLLHRFTRDRFDDRTARLAVVALLLYPYAWYLFGAVYSDALFLALALGAFVLAEADHLLLAGLCGALATATRPVGIAVLVGLVVLELTRRDASRRCRRIDLALLSGAGLVAWCTYLGRAFGDPFAFVKVEGAPGWDEPLGTSTLFKVGWIRSLERVPEYIDHHTDPHTWYTLMYTVGATFQAVLAVGAVALLPRIYRRLGPAYAAYTAVAVGLAIVGSKDWQGDGRYLLAAFPVFVVVGDLIATKVGRHGRVAMATASGCLLVFLTSAFARGHYLA